MNTTLVWIIVSGVLMSAIALVGALTLIFKESTFEKILLPLVAFSAGSLLGGAFFHMIPAAIESMGNGVAPYIWTMAGFTVFFCLEQFLHWHHCHRAPSAHNHKKPLTYLVLLADGLHNFIGGLGVGGSFLIDIRVGMATWLAAAAHEVPQELGDFGVLIYGGWDKKKALIYNLLSALTFLLGSILAYWLSFKIDVRFLVPFAAGNFIYIAAADLIPEVARQEKVWANAVHLFSLVAGMGLLLAVKLWLE